MQNFARVSELADDHDSKSCGSNPVWVQVPPRAHKNLSLELRRFIAIFLVFLERGLISGVHYNYK